MRLVEKIVNRGHGYCSPSYLAIHETSNPGASAANHVKLYSSGTWQYAVQYVCDWTETVYHCVPDDRKAWAVGNGNSRCVNLEICHATNQGDFDRAYQTAVEFAAWYLGKRGWGMDRLISHDDARRMWGGTDHTDPIDYFRQYGKSWQQFCSDVQDALGGGAYTVKHEAVDDSTPQRPDGLLRKGDSGSAVSSLQSRLNAIGYSCGAVDGIFGNRTRDDVRAFQRSAGLSDDGIAGPKTYAALAEAEAAGGHTGVSSIADVQRWLGCTADGICGPDTMRHLIRRLQQELNSQFGSGIAEDGIWGPRTRAACVNVRRGASGNITRVLQGCLICRGFALVLDGVFGGDTDGAVRAFQRAHGLSDDGIAGRDTWTRLLG